MSDGNGDKDRRLILEIVKLALPALLAWGATDHVKQKEVDRCAGALDTSRGYIYEGQSPSYYSGYTEQRQIDAAAEGGQ